MTQAATAALEASGVQVDREARPDLDPGEALDLGHKVIGDAAMSHSRPDTADGPSHREWLDLNVARAALRARWAEFFTRFDAILMPVVFVPPFPHDHEGDVTTRTVICNGETRPFLDFAGWTVLTGLAYLPSTVPRSGWAPRACRPGCRWWAPTARIGARSGWRRGSPNAAAAIRFPRSHDESRGGTSPPYARTPAATNSETSSSE